MDADETGRVLEALLYGGNDVLRYLWMSFSDHMTCPVKPRPWRGILPAGMERHDAEILSLMIDTRRW